MKIFITIFICLITLSLSNKANAQTKFDISAYPIHVQSKNTNKPIILFITGDGGWNSFSTQLTNELARNGYPFIAFDSKKYFWDKKTPLQFGKDVQIILDQYLKEWNKESFIIVGYSFGADVCSFLPANLSKKLSDKLDAMVLLSPGYSTGFEVKLMGMLSSGGPSNSEKYKVYPELMKLKIPVSCI
ncbi:MAG: virulence factor, partial [Bacteroidetes bacterium]|nr:virulence factor [Bacteroidota bacterium]